MGAVDFVTRRQILQAVADGRLAPSEAAVRLAHAGETDAERADLELLSVRSAYRYLRVVGDASVDHVAVVSGQHSLVREGGVLRLTDGHATAAFAFAEAAPTAELLVRVNPRLSVEVDSTGGRLQVQDLSADLQVTVKAGSASLDGITGPLQLDVVGASVTLQGTPAADWRIRAESASVFVRLGSDADASVIPTGRHSNVDVHGQTGPVTLGNGTHSVSIDVAFCDLHVG
jgi:hypothetical protein